MKAIIVRQFDGANTLYVLVMENASSFSYTSLDACMQAAALSGVVRWTYLPSVGVWTSDY